MLFVAFGYLVYYESPPWYSDDGTIMKLHKLIENLHLFKMEYIHTDMQNGTGNLALTTF